MKLDEYGTMRTRYRREFLEARVAIGNQWQSIGQAATQTSKTTCIFVLVCGYLKFKGSFFLTEKTYRWIKMINKHQKKTAMMAKPAFFCRSSDRPNMAKPIECGVVAIPY